MTLPVSAYREDMALSERAHKDWQFFVAGVDWEQPSEGDWARFYDFVIGTHQRNEGPSLREFGEMLESTPTAGVEARKAFYLAYDVARELLPQYDNRRH